jgi:hypothetical protein
MLDAMIMSVSGMGCAVLAQTPEENIVRMLTQDSVIIPGIIATSIVFIVTVKTIATTIISRGRERSRREIAAFIAEGSMTPEQGERLMKAGGEKSA